MIFKISPNEIVELFSGAKTLLSTLDVKIKNAVSNLLAFLAFLPIGPPSSHPPGEKVIFDSVSAGGLPLFFEECDFFDGTILTPSVKKDDDPSVIRMEEIPEVDPEPPENNNTSE